MRNSVARGWIAWLVALRAGRGRGSEARCVSVWLGGVWRRIAWGVWDR